MTELSKDTDAFCAEVRGLDAPPEGARELVRAQLTKRLGNVWETPSVQRSAEAIPRRRFTHAPLKALTIAAIGGMLGIGAWRLQSASSSSAGAPMEAPSIDRTPEARASASDEIANAATTPPDPARTVSPWELPSASDHATPALAERTGAPPSSEKVAALQTKYAGAAVKRAPESEPTREAGSLEEETRLLRSAHSFLLQGEGARALVLLQEHQLRFPKGVLRQERRGEQVLVLCALGRRGEARELSSSFLSEEPSSMLAERVRASCVGEP
ncbi:MAG: hypothetical protein BGO98_12680 [Myxococcales bacterium 68-20]|nr:MAG: hypothetical protein BGO98_12680 [Myxococcales bacterium 68-20]